LANKTFKKLEKANRDDYIIDNYKDDENIMNTYLNISEIINLKREKVLKERQSFGPRVIVVGST
jgi:hypothetical protein